MRLSNEIINCPAPPRFSRNFTDVFKCFEIFDSIFDTYSASKVFFTRLRLDLERFEFFTCFCVSATDYLLFIISCANCSGFSDTAIVRACDGEIFPSIINCLTESGKEFIRIRLRI